MSKTEEGSDTQLRLDELLSLHQAAELSGLSASHLRLLVRKGDMWGIKVGRNWLTTKQAVNDYLAHEHRPGPKTKQPLDPE